MKEKVNHTVKELGKADNSFFTEHDRTITARHVRVSKLHLKKHESPTFSNSFVGAICIIINRQLFGHVRKV